MELIPHTSGAWSSLSRQNSCQNDFIHQFFVSLARGVYTSDGMRWLTVISPQILRSQKPKAPRHEVLKL